MVQGSWVGVPNPASFILFSVLFFIPYESICCPGWGWVFHPLRRSISSPSRFSLVFPSLSLSLALMPADYAVAEVGVQ